MTHGHHHDLFVHGDDHRLAAHMAPFAEEGLDDGASVLVVLGDRHAEVLQGALDARAGEVRWIDRDGFYTRPEAALARYDATLRDLVAQGAPAVRVLGALPRLSTEAEWARWSAYDAILNRAFTHHPVWIMCVYDTRETPPEVVDAARRAHPRELTDTLRPCPDFHAPEDVVRALEPPAGALDDDLWVLPAEGAAPFRHALAQALDADGRDEAAARDLLLAAGEIYNNATVHGGGVAAVRAGRVGDRFVCEIADRGAGFDDPLAGYLPPRPGGAHGAGLWIARQASRRLEVTRAGGGNAVRVWI